MTQRYEPEPLFQPIVIVLTLAAITVMAILLTTG
jgi:hypothetical protein